MCPPAAVATADPQVLTGKCELLLEPEPLCSLDSDSRTLFLGLWMEVATSWLLELIQRIRKLVRLLSASVLQIFPTVFKHLSAHIKCPFPSDVGFCFSTEPLLIEVDPGKLHLNFVETGAQRGQMIPVRSHTSKCEIYNSV